MWCPLQKDPPYLIKIVFKEDFYQVCVTNFIHSWRTTFTSRSFLNVLKKSNDGVEFENENDLIKKGVDMLENPQDLKKVSIHEDEGQLTISMIKVDEFPLLLKLDLVEASCENFFEQFLKPLITTISDLHSSQTELRELLKKKDREIDRFRSEGQVPRREKTQVYNDAAHMAKHTAFEVFFGAPGMADLLQAGANAEVKKQPKLPTAAEMKNDQPSTAQSTRLQHVTENSKVPKIVPKIEKHSQNANPPNAENPTCLPTTVKRKGPEFEMESTVEVKKVIKTETKDPIPRKRLKNRLNY